MRPYEMWNIHTYRNFADHKNKNKVSTQPASARRKVRLPPSQVPRDESMRFDDELCAVAELIRCPSLPRATTSDPAHPEKGFRDMGVLSYIKSGGTYDGSGRYLWSGITWCVTRYASRGRMRGRMVIAHCASHRWGRVTMIWDDLCRDCHGRGRRGGRRGGESHRCNCCHRYRCDGGLSSNYWHFHGDGLSLDV